MDVKVFKNLTAEDIHDSVELFEKAIDQAQIIMFPGGFSAGDEPDGSAKFFATAFQNAKIKEAVMNALGLEEEETSGNVPAQIPEAGTYQVTVAVRSDVVDHSLVQTCLLYTSPSPRD